MFVEIKKDTWVNPCYVTDIIKNKDKVKVFIAGSDQNYYFSDFTLEETLRLLSQERPVDANKTIDFGVLEEALKIVNEYSIKTAGSTPYGILRDAIESFLRTAGRIS